MIDETIIDGARPIFGLIKDDSIKGDAILKQFQKYHTGFEVNIRWAIINCFLRDLINKYNIDNDMNYFTLSDLYKEYIGFEKDESIRDMLTAQHTNQYYYFKNSKTKSLSFIVEKQSIKDKLISNISELQFSHNNILEKLDKEIAGNIYNQIIDNINDDNILDGTKLIEDDIGQSIVKTGSNSLTVISNHKSTDYKEVFNSVIPKLVKEYLYFDIKNSKNLNSLQKFSDFGYMEYSYELLLEINEAYSKSPEGNNNIISHYLFERNYSFRFITTISLLLYENNLIPNKNDNDWFLKILDIIYKINKIPDVFERVNFVKVALEAIPKLLQDIENRFKYEKDFDWNKSFELDIASKRVNDSECDNDSEDKNSDKYDEIMEHEQKSENSNGGSESAKEDLELNLLNQIDDDNIVTKDRFIKRWGRNSEFFYNTIKNLIQKEIDSNKEFTFDYLKNNKQYVLSIIISFWSDYISNKCTKLRNTIIYSEAILYLNLINKSKDKAEYKLKDKTIYFFEDWINENMECFTGDIISDINYEDKFLEFDIVLNKIQKMQSDMEIKKKLEKQRKKSLYKELTNQTEEECEREIEEMNIDERDRSNIRAMDYLQRTLKIRIRRILVKKMKTLSKTESDDFSGFYEIFKQISIFLKSNNGLISKDSNSYEFALEKSDRYKKSEKLVADFINKYIELNK